MRTTIALALVLVTFSAAAGEAVRLTPEGAEMRDVRLSPDGRTAVFMLNRSGKLGGDVAVLDLTTRELTNLTLAAFPDAVYGEAGEHVQFTPDGAAVVFIHGTEIWRAPLDGGAPTQLTERENATGLLVVPSLDAVLFSSRRSMSPSDLEGKAPEGVAGFVITKLYRLDLKTRKISLFTRDMVADTDKMALLPDGRIVTIAAYGDGTGRYSDRAVTILDLKGRRSRVCGPRFEFPPVYVEGGARLVLMDQVFDEKADAFTYPLTTWNTKTLKGGPNLDLKLPAGDEIGKIWSVPGYRHLVISVGTSERGYRLFRWDPSKKALTPLCSESFGTTGDGVVTPDGARLLFQGGARNVSRGPLMSIPLN